MENERKRARSVNFTKAEVQILTDIVYRFRCIVENKKTDAVTNKEKEEAWQQIANSFNAVSGVAARTAKTLKLKYEGVKKEVKKKSSQNRQELYRTGGGGPAAVTFTDVEEKVLGICSNITGLDARFDNDIIEGPELPVILDETEIVTVESMDPPSIADADAKFGKFENGLDEDAGVAVDSVKTALNMVDGRDGEEMIKCKPDTKWQTWTPRSLKSKVSPLLRPKVTKSSVSARIDELTTARLELVNLQMEIARKELKHKEIEHNLRITHMLNEEQRNKEVHEMKMKHMLI